MNPHEDRAAAPTTAVPAYVPKTMCLLGVLRLDAGNVEGARESLVAAERQVAELEAAAEAELADNVADLREAIDEADTSP